MQVADNMPLYGVCCVMDEIAARPPSLAREAGAAIGPRASRYLVAAPRCYCLLTHYPFFMLHLKASATYFVAFTTDGVSSGSCQGSIVSTTADMVHVLDMCRWCVCKV